eukprot:TRINITY_DN5131_c0_g1_i3.p1 TRINITY_DN5131_c0_g1~~TRINITY_DN5131_c0_g1_i3.p1  ORF type:complete len:584 (+),score=79.14 TRINITY_DN5131_c0_g1_i3:43-1794(+)
MSYRKDYCVKPISLVKRDKDSVKLSRVKSLVKLSASCISRNFILRGLHCEDRNTKKLEVLESYFSPLPWILRGVVYSDILKNLSRQQDICLTLLPETGPRKCESDHACFLPWKLFASQSKLLNLSEVFSEGSGGNEILHFVLDSEPESVQHFSKLVLSSCEISSTNLSYTYEVTDSIWKPQLHTLFTKLVNISHLVLKYFCDDDTLSIVGKFCKNLHYLEIHLLPETMKDQQLTDEGFEDLIQYQVRHPSIKEINLKECYSQSVTSRSTISLSEIPSLHTLHIRSFHLSWISLQICNSKRDTFPASTTLKNLSINFFTDGSEVMDTMKNCFDVVPEPRFVQFLLELIPLFFNRLERINLDGIHGDLLPIKDETLRFLKNVVSLRIKKLPRLLELTESLPRLQELELYYVPFSTTTFDESCPSPLPPFQSLTKLSIYKDSFRHSILLSDLKHLLHATPALRDLKIHQLTIKTKRNEDLDNINEDELINLFESIPHLRNLTTLHLILNDSRCLTERTLMFLLSHCPWLEDLNNLLYWNVSYDTLDVKYLTGLGYSISYGSRYHWGLPWKGDDGTVYDPEAPVDRF